MKKAFDQNVSRAKPRLRLGAFNGETVVEQAPAEGMTQEAVEAIAATVSQEPVIPNLASAIRTRANVQKAPKVPATVALKRALEAAPAVETHVAPPPAAPAQAEFQAAAFAPPVPSAPSPKPFARFEAPAPVAFTEPPPAVVEVQTAPPAAPEAPVEDPAFRRERLKERLSAVRQNPRPEPLPETVAEAGVMAVERISALQTELSKVRALNLTLTQDLEASRRQAELATEEARVRMDEARRLSGEMEGRAKLLAELEKELSNLEGERDEALLKLQETRAALEQGENDKVALQAEIVQRDVALKESLEEEERLATDLETAHQNASNLRKAADALRQERDTLSRQVADLTKERAELLEARRALEAVHRALAHAVSR